MKKVRLHRILYFLLCFFLSFQVNGQSAVSLNFSGIGYHPFGNPNYRLYENIIGESGAWVVEPGAYLSYEKFIRLTHTSLQLTSGLYSDAAAQFAGYTGLYFKRKVFHKYKHSFTLAAGGAYLYRKDWSEMTGYHRDYNFNVGKKYETCWSFTSELMYYHYLTGMSDINIGFLYGHQYHTFTFVAGIRYWFNPIVKFRECDECGENKFNRGKLKRWIKLHIKV